MYVYVDDGVILAVKVEVEGGPFGKQLWGQLFVQEITETISPMEEEDDEYYIHSDSRDIAVLGKRMC